MSENIEKWPQRWVVFDTETSGLPNYKAPADDPSQPRLAAVTFVLTDANLVPVDVISYYVKPDGWSLAPEMEAINGLTQAVLEEKGVPIREVLQVYTNLIDEGYAMAAYGAQFDLKVMRGELRRAEIDDRFDKTLNTCVMRKSMGVVVKQAKKGGFPKLTDCIHHFNIQISEEEAPAGAPKCQVDALATVKVFQWLRKIGIKALEPTVHYAADDNPAKPQGTPTRKERRAAAPRVLVPEGEQRPHTPLPDEADQF